MEGHAKTAAEAGSQQEVDNGRRAVVIEAATGSPKATALVANDDMSAVRMAIECQLVPGVVEVVGETCSFFFC